MQGKEKGEELLSGVCMKVLHRTLRHSDFILKGWRTIKGRCWKWSLMAVRKMGWKVEAARSTRYGSRVWKGKNRVKRTFTDVKQDGMRNQEWIQILTLAWLSGRHSSLNWGHKEAKRYFMIKVSSSGVGSYLLQGLQTFSFHYYHTSIMSNSSHFIFSDSLRAFVKAQCRATPPIFQFYSLCFKFRKLPEVGKANWQW